MNKEIKQLKQMKSKQRVRDYGEVYTPQHIVNDMLDLVKHETERIDSRFLEPACGNGNFLAEILRRKLNIVDQRYNKTQIQWEYNSIIAVSSIYGVDILEDNAEECRKRLFNIFKERYNALFADKCKPEVLRSVDFLLHRNILWGDALDFTNPQTKQPIIFSEWSAVNGTMLKRKDYMFKFLVEKTFQTSLFDDEGNAAAIDEPVKDYPLVHFLKLSESEFSALKDGQDEKV
ncbi:MAG: type III restriction endonuclease subunit M [Raineya sp.]